MGKCIDCIYYDIQQLGCQLLKIGTEKTDTCPLYTNKDLLDNCDVCGQPCITRDFIFVPADDNRGHFHLCKRCASLSGTCGLCIEGDKCDFETNPSTLPKQVIQVMTKGNMKIQQEVPNPERIKITCMKGCKCFSEEFGCLKRNCGTCGNYKRCFG